MYELELVVLARSGGDNQTTMKLGAMIVAKKVFGTKNAEEGVL
jgi:hypothetical protein